MLMTNESQIRALKFFVSSPELGERMNALLVKLYFAEFKLNQAVFLEIFAKFNNPSACSQFNLLTLRSWHF